MNGSQDFRANYISIPGGAELLKWFGHVPTFHDAEIISLNLHRSAASSLSLYAWYGYEEIDGKYHKLPDRDCIVTFKLEDVMDLQLDGFSRQNVIGHLEIWRGPPSPERRSYIAMEPSALDYELRLGPCYGLDGYIRCRNLSVSIAPGKPGDACW